MPRYEDYPKLPDKPPAQPKPKSPPIAPPGKGGKPPTKRTTPFVPARLTKKTAAPPAPVQPKPTAPTGFADLSKFNVPRKAAGMATAQDPITTRAGIPDDPNYQAWLKTYGLTSDPTGTKFAPGTPPYINRELGPESQVPDPYANVPWGLKFLLELQGVVSAPAYMADGAFSPDSTGDADWWGQAQDWMGMPNVNLIGPWFRAGLLGLNFIQKIPERLLLTPMIAGFDGPPGMWWGSLLLREFSTNDPLTYVPPPTVINANTGEEGHWGVNAIKGWQFTPVQDYAAWYIKWAAKQEGKEIPDWKLERAYDFEDTIVDPVTDKIRWDVLVGKYDVGDPDFLNQLFDTTGLSGISVSLALQPEKWSRFTEMIDNDASMTEVMLELEDPWAEFGFNALTDPLLWAGVVAPAKVAALTYIAWPVSYPLEKASAWAINTGLRGAYTAKGAVLREMYAKQGSAKRWLLTVSKQSQHNAYSDAVEDTFQTLALRYDPTIHPEPTEFYQRALLKDTQMYGDLLGPQRTAQLEDAIDLLGETIELDLNTVLEHYGPFADLLESKKIAEVALEGALADPEVIGHYISRAISDQYAKQLGIHPAARGSIARNLNWMGRLFKEQWLAVNPGYLVNNFLDNTVKTVVSNNNPTFDLHAAAKAATYLGDTFDEVLPANVAQSMVADAFDVNLDPKAGRRMATADLPWPLGEPEGWAKTIRFITGQKLPDKIYDWMAGDTKAIRWMRQASYSGILRRGFNVSSAIERSARANVFMNSFDDFINTIGTDRIMQHIASNPDVPQEFVELITSRAVRKPADFDAALAKIVGRFDDPVPDTWVSGTAPAGTPDFEFFQALRTELDNIQRGYVGDYNNPQFGRKVNNAFARARKAAKDIFRKAMDETLAATETDLEHLARTSGIEELETLVEEAARKAGVPLDANLDGINYDEAIRRGQLSMQDMARVAQDEVAYSFIFDPALMTDQLDMAAAGRYPNNPVIGVLFEDLPNADSLRELAKELAETPGDEIYRRAIDLYNMKYRLPKGLPPLGQAFPQTDLGDFTGFTATNRRNVEKLFDGTYLNDAIAYDPETGKIGVAEMHSLAAGDIGAIYGADWPESGGIIPLRYEEGVLIVPKEGVLSSKGAQDLIEAGLDPSTKIINNVNDEALGTLGDFTGFPTTPQGAIPVDIPSAATPRVMGDIEPPPGYASFPEVVDDYLASGGVTREMADAPESELPVTLLEDPHILAREIRGTPFLQDKMELAQWADDFVKQETEAELLQHIVDEFGEYPEDLYETYIEDVGYHVYRSALGVEEIEPGALTFKYSLQSHLDNYLDNIHDQMIESGFNELAWPARQFGAPAGPGDEEFSDIFEDAIGGTVEWMEKFAAAKAEKGTEATELADRAQKEAARYLRQKYGYGAEAAEAFERVAPEAAASVKSYNNKSVRLILAQEGDAPTAIIYDPGRRAIGTGPFHPAASDTMKKELGEFTEQITRFSWEATEGNLVLDEGVEFLTPQAARDFMDAGMPGSTTIYDPHEDEYVGVLRDYLGAPGVAVGLSTAERKVFTADQLASLKGLVEDEGIARLVVNEELGAAAVDADPEKALQKMFDTLGFTETQRNDFFDLVQQEYPTMEWTIVDDARALKEGLIDYPEYFTGGGPGEGKPIYIMHDATGDGFSLGGIKPLVDAGLDPNGTLVYAGMDGSGQYQAGTLGQMYSGFIDGLIDDAPAVPSIVPAYNIVTDEWEWHRQSKLIEHLQLEDDASFMYDVMNGHIILGEPGAPHTTIQVDKYSGYETTWIAIQKVGRGEWFLNVPDPSTVDQRLMNRVQRLLRIVGNDGDDIFNQMGTHLGQIGSITDFSAEQRLTALRAGLDDPFMKYDRTDLGPAIVFDSETGEISSGVVHYDAAAFLGKPEGGMQQFRIDDGRLFVFGSIYEDNPSIYGQPVTREGFQALLDAGIPGDIKVTGSGLDSTLAELAANFSPTKVLQPMYAGPIAIDELWDSKLGVAGWWDDINGEFRFQTWYDLDGNHKMVQAQVEVANEGVAGNEVLSILRPSGADETLKISLNTGYPEADRVAAEFFQYLDNLGIAADYPMEVNGVKAEFGVLFNRLQPYLKTTGMALVEQFRIGDLANANRVRVMQLRTWLSKGNLPLDEFNVPRKLIGIHDGTGNVIWSTQSTFHQPLLTYADKGIGEVGQFTLAEGKGIMTSTVDYDMAVTFAKTLEDLGAPDNMPFRVYLTGPPDPTFPDGAVTKEWIGSLGEFLGKEVEPTKMVLPSTDELMGAQAQLGLRNSQIQRNVQSYQTINQSIDGWEGAAGNKIAQGIDTRYVSGPEAEAATTATASLKDEWLKMLEDATYNGIGETNRVLFDYSTRNSWEEVLRTYAPFTTWQLRNPLFWAQAFVKQPSLISTAVAYHRASEISKKKRNLTGRFDNTVGVDTPGGGYLAADVSKIISIFGQYREPFDAPGTEVEQAPGLMGAMQWIVQQGRSFGINPWPWWSYPMEKAGVIPEGTTQVSFGPQQRVIEMALRQSGVLEPGESAFGMTATSEFLMSYWTNRRLVEMEAEGLIDHGQFIAALENPENVDWQAAEAYVADLQTKFGVIGLFNPFTLKYASPGEVMIRESLKEKKELPAEVKQWFNTTHPYLESYNMLFEGEVDRAVTAVFYKYETLIKDLNPWEAEYKQISAERAAELEAITGPQAPTYELKTEYLANPIEIGGPDDIGGIYDEVSAQTSTLHRLRDIEPRAGEYTLDDGVIDWETYNTDLDNFMDNIELISENIGMPMTVDSYIKFRYRWAAPEKVAYDLYKQWRSEGWEVYESLQPEADGYLDLINWAAEQQFMKDLSVGFTPIEAGKLKAENLTTWSVSGLPYEYRQELLGVYSRPINLRNFGTATANILGMDPRGEERFVLNYQLDATMPDIFGEDDPIQSMTGDMYDYYYNLMPDEKRDVREFLGLEQFDLADLSDAEVTNLYEQLRLEDRSKLIKEGVLMYDEPQGLAILPTWDNLTPEETQEVEQLRVDWYRYSKARESGVYGTWTDLMEKYYSTEDSGAGRFWSMLNGISLSSAAFDDPVVGPLLSKATREILEPTDEQYEAAADYLETRLEGLIDQEKTDLIRNHPDWYELAQIQRGEFDKYRVLEMEIAKSQYYSIYYKERSKWEGENPEVWAQLRDYMAREKARALAFPYYSYFFKSYDYGNFYGGRTPNDVPEDMAPKLSEDYLKAIDDMNAYLTGETGDWTDLMSQFFGAAPATSEEDSMWIPADQYHEVGRQEVNRYQMGEMLYGFKHDPLLTDAAKKLLESTVKVMGTEVLEEEGRARFGFMQEERDPREHTSYTVGTTDLKNITLMRHEAAHVLDQQYEVSQSQEFREVFFPMDTMHQVVANAIDDPYRRVEAAYDSIVLGGYMPVQWPQEFFSFLFAELAANPEDVPPILKEFYAPYIKFP